MKIVLIDLDGPLANFESGFLEIWKKSFPEEFFLPLEKRGKFYLKEDYPENLKSKIESIINSKKFFINLSPIKEGLDAIKDMVEEGFKIFICSSGIYKNKSCLAEKKLWIEKYLGEGLAKTAIFTRDKTIIKGDYLIDDKPEISGIAAREWQQIIFDQPFNRDIRDKLRLKMDWSNWKELIIH